MGRAVAANEDVGPTVLVHVAKRQLSAIDGLQFVGVNCAEGAVAIVATQHEVFALGVNIDARQHQVGQTVVVEVCYRARGVGEAPNGQGIALREGAVTLVPIDVTLGVVRVSVARGKHVEPAIAVQINERDTAIVHPGKGLVALDGRWLQFEVLTLDVAVEVHHTNSEFRMVSSGTGQVVKARHDEVGIAVVVKVACRHPIVPLSARQAVVDGMHATVGHLGEGFLSVTQIKVCRDLAEHGGGVVPVIVPVAQAAQEQVEIAVVIHVEPYWAGERRGGDSWAQVAAEGALLRVTVQVAVHRVIAEQCVAVAVVQVEIAVVVIVAPRGAGIGGVVELASRAVALRTLVRYGGGDLDKLHGRGVVGGL